MSDTSARAKSTEDGAAGTAAADDGDPESLETLDGFLAYGKSLSLKVCGVNSPVGTVGVCTRFGNSGTDDPYGRDLGWPGRWPYTSIDMAVAREAIRLSGLDACFDSCAGGDPGDGVRFRRLGGRRARRSSDDCGRYLDEGPLGGPCAAGRYNSPCPN